MNACSQLTINEQAFQEIGIHLKKLNIDRCFQFTDKIFHYLSKNTIQIEMSRLNISRRNKRK
jgi:ABC-type uncharacterized transport system substrate-binding protein